MNSPELPDFSDIEARVTAEGRRDLHFEYQDALTVQRGSLSMVDVLGAASHVQAQIAGHRVSGEILAVGADWLQLSTALVRLGACDGIQSVGEGHPESSILTFRQAVRQYAGRAPREVITVRGQSRVMVIEWVAADFLQVRLGVTPAMVPLAQVAAVFGALLD